VRLAVQDVPSSDNVVVEVKLPKGPVYVGERIPVRIEFVLEKTLQQNVLSYDLRAPLFDRLQQFRVLDSGASGDTKVVLQSAAGALELMGTTRSIRRDGRDFVAVSVERTLVPLSAGSYELPAATLSVQEGVRWRRDFFGGRRATKVRRWRAQDRARTLEVRSIPAVDRPESFAGAIGSGFTLDVAADRTVVQVGDPINLTFTLRGEGLETARLPPLDASGLLPGRAFRVPMGDLTGEIVGDAKRFRAVVRVLEEQVDEVPALAYSWFDPSSQRYQTTHSRPIALAVRSAEVIGAADVQGDEAPGSSAQSGRGPPAQSPEEEVGVRARSFALTGADLAIERNPAKLLATGRSAWSAPWVVGSLYGSALLLIPLAVWQRRRLDVDPALAKRRKIVVRELRRVERAGDSSPSETLATLSNALRQMLAQVPEAATPDLDAFLGECDARSYAPENQPQTIDAAFLERGVLLARGIAERVG
jgi:hypothetical protein